MSVPLRVATDPPAGGKRPEARSSCSSVASEHPRHEMKKEDQDVLPQQPPEPGTFLPEPPAADSYGTLIVQGGLGQGSSHLKDVWAFDISSRTWVEFPDAPPPTTASPSLALVDDRLYTFSAGQTSFMDLTQSSLDGRGRSDLGISPKSPWSTLPPTSSSPDKAHPGDRTNASMVPVTTGQGRNYLILIGGQSGNGDALEDIWALQLKPEGMTAASLKDAARRTIRKETNEYSPRWPQSE